MKNQQKIINDTIVDHDGHKRSTLMILGDPENGYVQGTILDANAIAEAMKPRPYGGLTEDEARAKGLLSVVYIDQTYTKTGTRLQDAFVAVPVGGNGEVPVSVLVYFDGTHYFIPIYCDEGDESSAADCYFLSSHPDGGFGIVETDGLSGSLFSSYDGSGSNSVVQYIRSVFEDRNIYCFGGYLRIGTKANADEIDQFGDSSDKAGNWYYIRTTEVEFSLYGTKRKITNDTPIYTLDDCNWTDCTPDESFVRIYGDVAVEKDEDGNVIYEEKYIKELDDDVMVQKHKPASENVISWIRENSKEYHADLDYDNFDMLKVIDAEIDGLADDEVHHCFMKLPKFWWKCSETTIKDVFKLEFAKDRSIVDSMWQEWDGDRFIGKYKTSGLFTTSASSKIGNNGLPKSKIEYDDIANVYSSGDANPLVYVSWNVFKDYIHNVNESSARGMANNLSLVSYESHIMMAILFYAYYGDTNAQKICGSSKAWEGHPRRMPVGEYRLQYDTRAEDNTDNVWFWGLQDWWGNVWEWVDNLKTVGALPDMTDNGSEAYTTARGNVGVFDTTMNTIKRIIRDCPETDEGPQLHMKLGENFDIIPRMDSQCNYPDELDQYDASWADNVYVGPGSGRVVRRSYYGDRSYGGVGYLRVGDSPDVAAMNIGSRLEYHGPWVEVENLD